jgi:Tat protein translocase TatB subunit
MSRRGPGHRANPNPDLSAKTVDLRDFSCPGICVTLMDMFGIGLPELVIILIVALLVVGPSKLPEVARSIGKALGDFRRMADDVKDTLTQELDREEEEKQKKQKDESQALKDTQDATGQDPAGEHASQKDDKAEEVVKNGASDTSEQKIA